VGNEPAPLTTVFLDTGGRIEVFYAIPEIGKKLGSVATGIESR
jgi:hypothetical protein